MSKALIACFRNTPDFNSVLFAKKLCQRLAPDNANTRDPYIYYKENVFSLIYNPSATVQFNGPNMCLGIVDNQTDLFKVNYILPNGSFALFRANTNEIEIATDYASSRTIWFYKDDLLFVAATSQRMIIALLGKLQLNEKACGWFISSGTLGPQLSWDRNIQMLPPRTAINLNRLNWSLAFDQDFNFRFNGNLSNDGNSNSIEELKSTIKESIENLKIDTANWTLALSGGMDSRSLLFYLKDSRLNSVTWGLSSSQNLHDSDAMVARRLSRISEIDNLYAEMDFKSGSFPLLIDRFLCASEGRIDHLAAYLDSLSIWGDLSSSGRGVIRGYDAFGRKPPVKNSYQVRRTCNLTITDDYPNSGVPDPYYITKKDIPTYLNQEKGESLGNWRDRLWLQHRTPITTAALEDIKLSYVEVINPLLSKPIVSLVQNLSLENRTNKKIWQSIVSEMFPGEPFAKREAVQKVGEILNLKEVKEYLCDNLMTKENMGLFSGIYIRDIVDNYYKNQKRHSIRMHLRRIIIAYFPKALENFIRANVNPDPLNYPLLALRILMIIKTKEMFEKDSLLGTNVNIK